MLQIDRCITTHFPLFSGFSNVYHSACVWSGILELGCITNFDMLFLVIFGFIWLVDEIIFMLILNSMLTYLHRQQHLIQISFYAYTALCSSDSTWGYISQRSYSYRFCLLHP